MDIGRELKIKKMGEYKASSGKSDVIFLFSPNWDSIEKKTQGIRYPTIRHTIQMMTKEQITAVLGGGKIRIDLAKFNTPNLNEIFLTIDDLIPI